MKLLDRADPLLERPMTRTLPSSVTEETLIAMRSILERRDLEVLAATQVGIEQRLLLGRIDGTIQPMVNPRIAYYDEEDYIYAKIPRIHTGVDFTCCYLNHIILEWEWCGNVTYTERCEMYGVQAALYQYSLGFLDGQPPWKFKKLIDW